MSPWDVFLGLIFAVAGAYIYLEARTFPNLAGGYPGPGLFPQILGVLFILSGLGIATAAAARGGWPKQAPLSQYATREKVNALLVVLAIIFYMLFVDVLGFIPVILVILIGLMLRTGVSLRWSLVLGVSLTLAAYILFNRILKVPLPAGILRWWL